MTDYSQLKDSILEQAHEKGRKLVAEATAKVQAEAQLQEARLVEEKLHQRAVQLQTIERRLQRESQQIENQKRQSTLVTKQRVLKELFADAYHKMATWSREEELAFLHRVLPRYADQAMVLTLGAVTAEKLTDQDRQDLIEAYPQLQLAKETLKIVGLPEEVLHKSPFDLSGGQMRRVAIAGVLAMQPEVLVLDEPTAGLDPKGRLEMMEMFAALQREKGITIVLVTHQMNDVSEYADYVIVCEKGTVVKTGTPEEVFADASWLQEKQLGLPSTIQFVEKLKAKGFQTDARPMNLEALADLLVSHSKNGGDTSAR